MKYRDFVTIAILIAFLIIRAANAQTTVPTEDAFEVVSIRANPATTTGATIFTAIQEQLDT